MPNENVDQTKLKWLQDIAPRFALSEKNLEMLEHRTEGQRLIGALDALKGGIREELMSIEVRVKKEELGSRTKMKLLEGDGDYGKEIDTVHHAKLMKEALSPAQMQIVQEQLDKIYKVRDQLKGNPYYDPGEPPEFTEPVQPVITDDMDVSERARLEKEFSDAVKQRKQEEAEWNAKVAECERHVTEDLYTPLVREGIIPENFVPQKHSEVARQFEEAAALYDERLQEYTENLTEADLLQQKFDTGFKIGSAFLKLAGSVSGLTGDIAKTAGEGGKQVADGADVASEVIEYMEIALTLSEGVAKAVITEKDMVGVGLALADAVGAVLTKATDDETAGIITQVVANGARGVRVGRALKENPPDYDAAFGLILEGMCGALTDNDPEQDGGLMTELAGYLELAGNAALQGKNIRKMVERGDPPLAILSALVDMADPIATDALKKCKLIPDEDDEDEDEGGEEDPSEDLRSSLSTIKDKITPEKLKRMDEEADRKMAETIKRSAEEAAEEERKQFEHHLAMGFPLASDDQDRANIAEFDRINSIEYLIAMQKKNEATFKICTQIAEKGAGFVAKLFPPTALAQALMTLALTIKDAIEKTQEMMVWRENVDDATTAVSPVVDAMLNRSGLQTKQAMQAQVQTALDAAKVVAEVLAMTPAAPAAPVVKSAVSTTEAAIEVTDLIYTEAKLAAAWKIYQQAREVPEDRWLARKATRENPTLSKYAMAWASLNGDVVAAEGMRRCGLNKQVLANPDTNVSKVVTYLETKYAEDPVLLRAVPSPEGWHPGQVELTATSWMKFYNAAVREAGLDATQDVSGITAAIGRLDEAEVIFADAMQDVMKRAAETTKSEHKETPVTLDQGAMDALSLCLMQLRAKIDGYKPKEAESGATHKTMASYVDALRALSEKRSDAIDKIGKAEPWLAKLKEDPQPSDDSAPSEAGDPVREPELEEH